MTIIGSDMSYVIVKAEVGFIVRPDYGRRDGGVYWDDTTWAAFDTWEQASNWLAKKFSETKE